MKKRLHDKKAGIAILISLIVISIAEIIFRAVAMGEAVLTTANLGEQLAVIALAATILILTAKGKNHVCYILYGAWIGYFVLDQLFELPGAVIDMVRLMSGLGSLGGIFRVVVSICIIGIGVLLLEYMNDGTIYNKAFNAFCLIAVLLSMASVVMGAVGVVANMPLGMPDMFTLEESKINVLLDMFNSAYRATMVFLCSFFAYDSAKAQLKKTDLTK